MSSLQNMHKKTFTSLGMNVETEMVENILPRPFLAIPLGSF